MSNIWTHRVPKTSSVRVLSMKMYAINRESTGIKEEAGQCLFDGRLRYHRSLLLYENDFSSNGWPYPNYKCNCHWLSPLRCRLCLESSSGMTIVEFHRTREPRLLKTISIRSVFMTCMVCPIAAILVSFGLGSTLHPSELFNYRWTCGIVHLPSVSRIMNMSLGRIIFQTLVLSSIPLRLLVLLKHWLQFIALEVSRKLKAAKVVMVISGVAEVLLLGLLTVIGERESGDFHVGLFACFATASYVYFICLCLLTGWTFSGSESDLLRARLQMAFLAIITFTMPIIILLFVLYNGFCVPFTYELFAMFEYVTVLAMYAFHVSSFSKMAGHFYFVHGSIKSRTQRV
uniref:G_PROTEIN_RECEP_F1_2 domain-containing protein n=1 Tax=Haemonchus contortus TaxID=6289 RepID=A0A7I4YRM4_HAECO